MSAGWLRLVKWSNIRNSRLNWEKTFLGNIIEEAFDSKITKEEFVFKLNEYGINQIKTGAFTRQPTEQMIEKIRIIMERKNKMNEKN